MSDSVSRAEVDSILADYGRQHAHANIHGMRRLLVDVFGEDFSTLQALKASIQDGAHVLTAAGNALITIHPTYATFLWGAPDYASPDSRGIYGGLPIVRWETARYGKAPRAGNGPSTTLCPNCYIQFPGPSCDFCGA